MLTPSKKAFIGGAATALAGAGAVHAEGKARKKARNRELLERIRGTRREMQSLPQRIIEFAGKIDLGRESYGICDTKPSSSPKKYYPSLWIDGQASPIDLPQSGRATVNYKVVSRTSREVDGKTSHDANIEIQSIEPEEKDKKKKPGAASAVKFSSLPQRIIAFARDRNADGEFAPQVGGGAGPAEMEKVYGTASLRRSPNLGGKVAAVAGGLGLGAAAILARNKLRSLRKV